ncbi:MAG: LuxR C-terminal-related transcriptional regulator [Cellvibrionales bacterium]|nr:LuxR C-terminal-related transcriptional regulator [Cellvibrionales bacterium]
MLSKGDFALTIDLINQCLSLNVQSDLEKFHALLSRKLGIDFLMLGQASAGFTDVQSYYFGLEQWKSHYDEENLLLVDPVISHALKECIPIRWQEAYQQAPKESQKFIEQSLDFGLEHGISFGNASHSVNGKAIMVSTGRKDYDIDIRETLILHQLLPHVAEALARPSLWERPHLTPKEREVIQWCSAGKGYWEIATIMNIAERTVKFHMKNICNKLNVLNKSQAVARCLSLGLIELQ